MRHCNDHILKAKKEDTEVLIRNVQFSSSEHKTAKYFEQLESLS